MDVAFGTGFAGGRGHFICAAEYVDDKGVLDRNSRRNLGSAGIVRVNPLSPTDLSVQRVRDVNYGYQSVGGLIMTGVLARSEEHTSELQSLMRISYAVFCLKKKTKTHIYSLPLSYHTYSYNVYQSSQYHTHHTNPI